MCEECVIESLEKENETLKNKFEEAHTMKATYQAETWNLKDENERLERLVARYEEALKEITRWTPCACTIIAKDALSARVSDSEQALEGKEPKS